MLLQSNGLSEVRSIARIYVWKTTTSAAVFFVKKTRSVERVPSCEVIYCTTDLRAVLPSSCSLSILRCKVLSGLYRLSIKDLRTKKDHAFSYSCRRIDNDNSAGDGE